MDRRREVQGGYSGYRLDTSDKPSFPLLVLIYTKSLCEFGGEVIKPSVEGVRST